LHIGFQLFFAPVFLASFHNHFFVLNSLRLCSLAREKLLAKPQRRKVFYFLSATFTSPLIPLNSGTYIQISVSPPLVTSIQSFKNRSQLPAPYISSYLFEMS